MPFASTGLRVVTVLLASISSSSIPSGSESHFVGHWEGTLVGEGIPLKVSFDFAEPHGQSKGTFTSVSRKAMDYPLDVFTVDAGAVHFVLGGAMVFDGKLNADKIIGTFTQDSAKGDFILRCILPEVLPYETVMSAFATARSPSQLHSAPRAFPGRMLPLYSCRAVVAKPLGHESLNCGSVRPFGYCRASL
jgi:hypothetical protein